MLCRIKGLLVIYSIGILALSGDTKEQISSAYHDMTRTALQTIKEKGWVSSQAEQEARRFTVTGTSADEDPCGSNTVAPNRRLSALKQWLLHASGCWLRPSLLRKFSVPRLAFLWGVLAFQQQEYR